MSFTRIVLEEDQAENYTVQRFDNEWKNEGPILQATELDIPGLQSQTRLYADFMHSKGLSTQEILTAFTYSKASLEALLPGAQGIRIYLAAREISDENGNIRMDIFPILVPVGQSFEDLIHESPERVNIFIDITSKCPPPSGACTEEKFKLLPR